MFIQRYPPLILVFTISYHQNQNNKKENIYIQKPLETRAENMIPYASSSDNSSDSGTSDNDEAATAQTTQTTRTPFRRKTVSQIAAERKVDNQYHTEFLKNEPSVPITKFNILEVMSNNKQHAFSPAIGSPNGMNIYGTEQSAERVLWSSHNKLVICTKEHALLNNRPQVTHQNSHAKVDGLPQAQNNCHSHVLRCPGKTAGGVPCSFLIKSHAKLMYENDDGIPTRQQWETFNVSKHDCIIGPNRARVSKIPYSAGDLAATLQDNEEVIGNSSNSNIKAAVKHFTGGIPVHTSMLSQIRRKLNVIHEGNIKKNMPFIKPLMQRWEDAGHFVNIDLLSGGDLIELVIHTSEKVYKKQFNKVPENLREPFDVSRLNYLTDGIELESDYLMGFQVGHKGLQLLSQADFSRVYEFDASHNQAALKGTHAASIFCNGNRNLILTCIGWSVRTEGGRFWHEFINSWLIGSPNLRIEPGTITFVLFFSCILFLVRLLLFLVVLLTFIFCIFISRNSFIFLNHNIFFQIMAIFIWQTVDHVKMFLDAKQILHRTTLVKIQLVRINF